MSNDEGRKLGLDDAYGVRTPEDNRRLYRDWADTYESDFMAPRGYVYHDGVAGLFATEGNTSGPVLDVGCGTGAVGEALQRAIAGGDYPTAAVEAIDGIDLSPEMLAVAATKGVYRDLAEADLTQPLTIADDTYGGVISAGIFTHGHLSAAPLDELIRIAAPNALFAIGINAEHYVEKGFEAFFAERSAASLITAPRLEEIRVYAAADDEHADDMALVALFRVH